MQYKIKFVTLKCRLGITTTTQNNKGYQDISYLKRLTDFQRVITVLTEMHQSAGRGQTEEVRSIPRLDRSRLGFPEGM